MSSSRQEGASARKLLRVRLACDPRAASYRLRHAATSLAACARAEMTAALLADRSRSSASCLSDQLGLAVVTLCGAARHDGQQ